MNINSIEIIENNLNIKYETSIESYTCDSSTKKCIIDPEGKYKSMDECNKDCSYDPPIVDGDIPSRLISTFTSELNCSNILLHKDKIIDSFTKLQFNCISLSFFKSDEFSSQDYTKEIASLATCLNTINMDSPTLCTDVQKECPNYNKYLIGTEVNNIFTLWTFLYLFKKTFIENNTKLKYGGKPVFIISFGGAQGSPFNATFDTVEHAGNFGKNCDALCNILEEKYGSECIFGIDIDIETPYGGKKEETSNWYSNFIDQNGFLKNFKKKTVKRVLTCEVFGCTSSIEEGSFYDSVFKNCSPLQDSTYCLDYISIMADNQAPQTCTTCQPGSNDKSECVKYNIYSYYKKFNWPLKNIFYLLYSDYMTKGFDNSECGPLLEITNTCDLSTSIWVLRIISELSQLSKPIPQHIIDAIETMVSSSGNCPSTTDSNNWICSCESSSKLSCNP